MHALCAVVALILGPTDRLSAQFRYYTTETGLPSNTVNTIYQDRQGFVWAGTISGLSRYNSLDFQDFDGQDNLLTGKNVYALCEPADSTLWIGSSEGLFALNRQHSTLRRIPIRVGDRIHETMIYRMKADERGNVWVGGYGQGLFRYDAAADQWKGYDLKSEKAVVSDILIGSDRAVWVLCMDRNIYRYNAGRDEFTAIPLVDRFTKRAIGEARCCCQDSFGDIWICDANADLFRLDLTTMTAVSATVRAPGSQITSRTLIEQTPGQLLVGTNLGLLAFDTAHRRYEWIDRGDRRQAGTLNDRFVHALMKDRDGGLWVGTYFGGIDYRPYDTEVVRAIYPSDGCGNIISSLSEMSDGRILVGSDDGGLSLYDPPTGSYERLTIDPDNRNLNIHSIFVDYRDIWVGTYGNGLYRLDTALGVVRHYGDDDVSTGDMNVYSIFRDPSEQLWIGTKRGICRYDAAGDRFERTVTVNDNCDILDICRTGDTLWFASQGGGVIRYDIATGRYASLLDEQPDSPSHATCLAQHDGRLYIGTMKGLYRLEGSSAEPCPSLPRDCVIKSLVADNSGLWITTDQGLFCYDSEERLRRFTAEDGFMSQSFSFNSAIRLSTGEILAGTDRGINAFHPKMLRETPLPRDLRVVITDFDAIDEKGRRSLSTDTGAIRIESDNASFSIDFVALNYRSPSKSRYRYRLAGHDDAWRTFTRDRNFRDVVYTDVEPGNYRFEVAAAAAFDEPFGPVTPLDIVVKRPLSHILRSGLLLAAAAALLAGTLLVFIRNGRLRYALKARRRESVRHRLYQNILEEIIREVNNTLEMQTLAARLDEGGQELPASLKSDFAILKNNILRLHRFIDERSAAYRRLASDQRSAVAELRSDLAPVVEAICTAYRGLAADCYGVEIDVRVSDRARTTRAAIDPTAMIHALTGLVDRMIDHADRRILLSLDATPEAFVVRIARDGDVRAGLPPVDEWLTRRGVAVVPVEPREGERVAAELRFALPAPETTLPETAADPAEAGFDAACYNIAVVDPSLHFRPFTAAGDGCDFRLVPCADPRTVLRALDDYPVAAVVYDAEAPAGRDEAFREALHNDRRHVLAVAVCNALTDADKRVCLRQGADICLAKPLSPELLAAQIEALLRLRRHTDDMPAPAAAPAVSLIDEALRRDKFSARVCDFIDSRLEDPELSVDDIAQAMNVSRATLFNRLKTTMNTTPNILIRMLRLERAARMLRQPGVRISEVYYTVGFISGSYFAKLFRQEFGVTPKEYSNRYGGEETGETPSDE